MQPELISNPVASELFRSLFSPSVSSVFSAVKSFRYNGQRYNIVDRCIGIVQTINSQQPTVNSQQPTANSQQPTVNSQHHLTVQQELIVNRPWKFPHSPEECLSCSTEIFRTYTTGRQLMLKTGYFMPKCFTIPCALSSDSYAIFDFVLDVYLTKLLDCQKVDCQ